MTPKDPFPHESDPSELDAEWESLLAAEDEDTQYALSEIERSNTLVDDTIDRLVAQGVNLRALEHMRKEVGECSGITATTEAVAGMQMHLGLRKKYGHNDGDLDNVPIERQDFEQLLSSFICVSDQLRQVKSLAHERGMHELAPRHYNRKRAEALILSDATILEADKLKWLAVIAEVFAGEPLNVHDPEARAYLTVHQAEDMADAMKDANVARLKQEFARLVEDGFIPAHDENSTMATLACFAIGYVSPDPEGQEKARQFSRMRATSQAKKLGWSDDLFEFVLIELTLALKQ